MLSVAVIAPSLVTLTCDEEGANIVERLGRRSLEEPKSKNYQSGKDEEDDRRHPIARAHLHGTIPRGRFVTLLTAIAQSISHAGVTFR
jgi:hypothetical protein